MKIRNYLFLLVMMAILAGCPYKSPVPITTPSFSDEGIVGKWNEVSEYGESENPNFMEVITLEGFKYEVNENTYNTTDEKYDVKTFTAHLTEIDDVRFLNMEPSDDEGSYFLFKIEMNGAGSFTLFEVTDNIDEEFTTSEELYAFVKEHMHLSFFYNQDEKKYNKE